MLNKNLLFLFTQRVYKNREMLAHYLLSFLISISLTLKAIGEDKIDLKINLGDDTCVEIDGKLLKMLEMDRYDENCRKLIDVSISLGGLLISGLTSTVTLGSSTTLTYVHDVAALAAIVRSLNKVYHSMWGVNDDNEKLKNSIKLKQIILGAQIFYSTYLKQFQEKRRVRKNKYKNNNLQDNEDKGEGNGITGVFDKFYNSYVDKVTKKGGIGGDISVVSKLKFAEILLDSNEFLPRHLLRSMKSREYDIVQLCSIKITATFGTGGVENEVHGLEWLPVEDILENIVNHIESKKRGEKPRKKKSYKKHGVNEIKILQDEVKKLRKARAKLRKKLKEARGKVDENNEEEIKVDENNEEEIKVGENNEEKDIKIEKSNTFKKFIRYIKKKMNGKNRK